MAATAKKRSRKKGGSDWQFLPGRTLPIEPQVIGTEFERIEAELGAVTAENVVDAARPEGSPLHHLFDWDVRSAAEKHWRHQAQKIIVSVVAVTPLESDQRPVQYVHVKTEEDGNCYMPLSRVLSRDELKAQYEVEAGAAARGFFRRYRDLDSPAIRAVCGVIADQFGLA